MFTSQMAMYPRTRYLPFLRRWVEAFACSVGGKVFPRSAQGRVSLALIEAVDNAIFHACPAKAAKLRRRAASVTIAMSLGSRRLVVDVVDGGKGIRRFPDRMPPPLATSGRGLFLMRHLMTRVTSRCSTQGHRLRMMVRL